jgi:hypothetical protein
MQVLYKTLVHTSSMYCFSVFIYMYIKFLFLGSGRHKNYSLVQIWTPKKFQSRKIDFVRLGFLRILIFLRLWKFKVSQKLRNFFFLTFTATIFLRLIFSHFSLSFIQLQILFRIIFTLISIFKYFNREILPKNCRNELNNIFRGLDSMLIRMSSECN